jgi:hypothetical protein
LVPDIVTVATHDGSLSPMGSLAGVACVQHYEKISAQHKIFINFTIICLAVTLNVSASAAKIKFVTQKNAVVPQQ